MFLLGEINKPAVPVAEKMAKIFEAETLNMSMKDALQVAGHLYEIMWMVYIATAIEHKEKAATMIQLMYQTNKELNDALVVWSRQKGKENGVDSTNLIQIPGQ